MATHTINWHIDAFDQDNTFTFAFTNYRGEQVRRGYAANFGEEGCFIMQSSACLKDSYTQKDIEETNRLHAMTPIRTGDTVIVDGKRYTAKILGDYSDAGRLIPE